MEMLAVGATLGKTVSLLVDKVIIKVELLAKGEDHFRGLQSLLRSLREPADYLKDHEDEAGGTLVHQWLDDFRNALTEANNLLVKWPTINKFNIRGRLKALKRLLRITTKIQSLNCQTVLLASNVCSFGRLGEEVKRVGGQVETCLESLNFTLTRLTVDSGEFTQAAEDLFAEHHGTINSDPIVEIKRILLGSTGSGPNPEARCGPSRSLETVTHFNAEEGFPDEVFGGNSTLDKLIAEVLHKDEYRKCIGLCSMGGAGKTFTAGRVFHDPQIQSYFAGSNCQIWVTVGQGRSMYSVLNEISES